MIHRFPTEVPADEVRVLLGVLTGRTPSTGEAIEAGWWVAGYAAGQVFDHPHPLLAGQNVLTRRELAAELGPLASVGEAGAAPVGALPWVKILQALLTILPLLFAEAQEAQGA